MKLQFVCYDNIDVIKSNLDSWVNKFKQPSSDWLSEELDQPLFSDTKFKEIKDFSLDMSADPKKAFLTEAENAIRVYSNLKFSPAFSALNRDSAVSLVAVVMWLCKHLPLSSFSKPCASGCGGRVK